jgi:hypothetical protein
MATAVVVLGHRDSIAHGAQHALISRACVRRVRRAQRAVSEFDAQLVVLTGYGQDNHPSEAAQMAACWNGPSVDMALEEKAENTAQNAALVLPLLLTRDITDVVVVSSMWHLRVPWYFRPYRSWGISCRFLPAVDFDRVARRVAHEARMVRHVPSVRSDAFALLAAPSITPCAPA